jgi:putative ABC transport system substrate-binding protein
MSGVDPVAAGLVASLNRPGGNLTGLSNFNTRLISKRFELLHQAVPRADTIAALVNPKTPVAQTIEAEARTAAQALGLRMDLLVASTEDEIDPAFGAAVQHGAGALLVGGDGYFNSRRAQFIALAARHRFPASFDRREIAMAGGLMSYGMNNFDMYRQVGIYTGQRVDHGMICGRSCANSDTVSALCACVDRTKFVAPASVGGPEFFAASV